MQRMNSIDILRGLSIIAVILLHAHLRIPFDKSIIEYPFFSSIYKILFWSGHYGVVVFFVISGFLITLSAMKRWGSLQDISCVAFYQIRFARIMPCLIGLLIILSIFNYLQISGFVINTEQASITQVIFSALTFHLNWLEAKTGYLPAPWSVLWSLSVEEAFYIFFPLFCLTLKNERHFIMLMIVFVILGPMARVYYAQNDIWADHSYLSCMDGIALGCIAGLLAHKIKFSKRQLNTLMITGCMFALFIIIFRTSVYNLGLTKVGLSITILEVGMSCILIALYQQENTTQMRSNFISNILQWFGRNCYEIYLTHLFCVLLFAKIYDAAALSPMMLPLWYLLILVASGVCGQWVAQYYSVPFNKKIRNINLKPVAQTNA